MEQTGVESQEIFEIGDRVQWKRQSLSSGLTDILFSIIEQGFCGPFVVTETEWSLTTKEHSQKVWIRQTGTSKIIDLSGFWLEKI